MFTIRGRLVCLLLRVRPSTQDVDELARPHFVYIGAWIYFDFESRYVAHIKNICLWKKHINCIVNGCSFERSNGYKYVPQ